MGVLLVRSLQVICTGNTDLLLVEGGIAPENFTGRIRRFKPDAVLMVDAADFGAAPGSVRQLEMNEMDGFSASTHTLPLSVLASFLRAEMGCEVISLGIQAQTVQFGQVVTLPVKKALREIGLEIKKMVDIFQDGKKE